MARTKTRTKTEIKAEHDRWFDAVCEEKIDVLAEMFEAGFDINTVHRKQAYTGAQFCGRWGASGTLEFLLSLGADINLASHVEYQPLWMAVKGNDYKMATRLVKAGARVNDLNHDGANIGLIVVRAGMRDEQLNLVREMIQSGLDVDAKNNEGVSVRNRIKLGIVAQETNNPQGWEDVLGAEQARLEAKTLDAATPQANTARMGRRTL